MGNNVNTGAKPFLRWAGGKSWLIKHLECLFLKDSFATYHEPFLGGASIYFHLLPERAFLSDLNEDLIDTYKQIKENVEDVISELAKFENNEIFYYDVRHLKYADAAKNAAKFIFLNQTSFNGIYRVNLKGDYNVPFGYRTKSFFEPENLRLASLSLKNANLEQGDFGNSLKNVQENDLVFLDPPYTVTHNNNGFIKYNKNLFNIESQYSLSKYIDNIKEKGAYYILSNAAHDEIKKIFKKENDKIIEVKRASLIGGKNAIRGQYAEYIITNIQ